MKRGLVGQNGYVKFLALSVLFLFPDSVGTVSWGTPKQKHRTISLARMTEEPLKKW